MKYFIPFLICLISLSGFGQSRFNSGLYLGYGQLDDYKLLHGGLKLNYDISSKFAITSGLYLNTTGILEVPLQLQYNLASIPKFDFNVFSGVAVNYILLDKSKFNYYLIDLVDSKYKMSFYGRKVERSLSMTLSNGVAFRYNNRLDIYFTFNYGLHNVIFNHSEQYLLDPPVNLEGIKAGFFDDPDEKIRNSYFALGLVFWNPVSTAERTAEIKSNKLHKLNAIFVEFLGALYIYSLNYDRIVLSTNNSRENVRIAVRAGINYLKDERFSDINYLFGISGLLGRNGHYFELGMGIQPPIDDTYDIGGHQFLGYRYQKNTFFLRGGLTVFSLGTETVVPWPGLGIGVAF